MPANQTRRRITRTDAPEHGADEPTELPPDLEGVNPLEPHPYHQNPQSPIDYCFCGAHKSDPRHGGPSAATAPVPKRIHKSGLKSAAEIAAIRAGVPEEEQQGMDAEEAAAAEDAVATMRRNREAALAAQQQRPAKIMKLEDEKAFGGIQMAPTDRLPIVDQALQLAQFHPEDSEEYTYLIRYATQAFLTYIATEVRISEDETDGA
jgi:hypothetical protein